MSLSGYLKAGDESELLLYTKRTNHLVAKASVHYIKGHANK